MRSGGHSPAGDGVTEGGIVLDVSGLRGLQVDAERRVAWAETGLTAGAYTDAAGAQGLATGFGDTGSVGIGGITLSGGIGFLARKRPPTASWSASTPSSTPTCSGRSAEAAATSAS